MAHTLDIKDYYPLLRTCYRGLLLCCRRGPDKHILYMMETHHCTCILEGGLLTHGFDTLKLVTIVHD